MCDRYHTHDLYVYITDFPLFGVYFGYLSCHHIERVYCLSFRAFAGTHIGGAIAKAVWNACIVMHRVILQRDIHHFIKQASCVGANAVALLPFKPCRGRNILPALVEGESRTGHPEPRAAQLQERHRGGVLARRHHDLAVVLVVRRGLRGGWKQACPEEHGPSKKALQKSGKSPGKKNN